MRELGGVPLVSWMCRAAAASKLTRVVITTEDAEIAAVAAANGAEVLFLREPHLAEDFAADHDIVVDALNRAESNDGTRYDIVVMIQPTTPFTLPEDIDGCLARLSENQELATCFTVKPVSEPPQWMFIENDHRYAIPLLDGIGNNNIAHKQLLTQYWLPSGAAYAIRASALRMQARIYCEPFALQPMDRARSVDIDEAIDLTIAEAIATMHGYQPVALNLTRPRLADTGDQK
ncbi:acylneuraminate cytidylyltransferase family protein [Tardiphaga alba]|nr:hypothetical protein [Tardiphaga alba]